VDPYQYLGPKPLAAVWLSILFSGLGQLYNGRWMRGIGAVAIPGLLLLVAAWTGSPVTYLIAFWAGVFSAPTVPAVLALLTGWVPLGHPAIWMGLPIKVLLVLDAGYDAYRIRLFRGTPKRRRWVRIAYGISLGALLLIWIFSTGLASVRQPHMNPVLEPGDDVVVDRLAFGVQIPLIGIRIGGSGIPRGALVALLDPDGSGRLLVRRVFATAGDRVDFGPPTGPARIRQPMLGPGGAPPRPVVWAYWPGPCVYALAVKNRREGRSYARCHAFVERSAKRRYRVSYPRRPGKVPDKVATGRVPDGRIYLLGDNRGGRDSRHWGAVSTRRIRGRPQAVVWSSDPLEGIRWHRMGIRVKGYP
jgi:signal peptidase I